FMPKNDIRLHINKGALLQVLMNLITNAIKYNDKEAIKITLGITEDAEYYHFSIKDNGLGILPKDQDKIFELFAVTGDRDKGGMLGSGIGLATVKKIVELQGGSISVDSERGIGSTFHFSMAKL
ncbi:MAG: sensor histidine kinase, partial [Bacteroidia bacterium]|nr:sensor histidine kinase [Bacteroidia bacterium]NNM21948.1 sensor histidine kinase [Flavobacteriaceae bacterium]